MPHAVSMPSFLADDLGPMSPSRPQFRQQNSHKYTNDKINGNTKSSLHMPTKNGYGDMLDGFIEKTEHREPSQLRTNDEVIFDEFSGTANSSDGVSSYNGSTISANCTFPVGGQNGDRESHHNGTLQTLHANNNSVSTAEHSEITATDTVPSTITDTEPPKRPAPPVPTQMPPNPRSASTYTNNHPATSLSNDPLETLTNTHRFSFPLSHTSNTPVTPSASTNSLPHSGPSELKQRHNLNVPKVAVRRPSGDDAIYTSGRFSATGSNCVTRPGSTILNSRNTQSVYSDTPHEEVPPDDNAMVWAEAVRQKRASKRRKRDDEDDDRVVVGTKVDQNHVNWVTAYNMLTGIRFTVSRTNAKIDRPLTNVDFEARHKFSFDITGNELTPSAKYDFKFKDYAPWVFRHLRARFKLDPADYLMSLTSKYILSELGSPGKSGSFFYFSRDYKYIIKTIHHAEHKFLRKILKEYYAHVEENPNTLLSQFYGLHRVKMPYGRKIHFVVMNNLFPPHRDIHQTFDLKGSTVGRDYKEEDLEKNPRATLKDLNWLRRDLHLEFGPQKRRLFFEQIEKDVQLLQRLGIMDYSMLVGIHNLQIGNQENLRDKTLQVFQPGGDNPSDEIERGPDGRGMLLRSPSKLENERKARELRQIIKQEKPIPMEQSSSRMPDTLEVNTSKKELLFYGDDGGFQATHEDNSPGEQIFFLSIIDCLTHYGTLKKLEHFFKGLKHDKRLISPVSPDPYGERFIEFIEFITKSPEEARREALSAPLPSLPHTNERSIITGQNRSINHQAHRAGSTYLTSQNTEKDASRGERINDDEADRINLRITANGQSTSIDRNGGLQSQALPVVEEIGEMTSSAGGSGSPDEEIRPATPPKSTQENASESRLSSVANKQKQTSNGRRPISLCSLDKDLPPLPT
ncbi:Phosphatidylinositol 4-phosphate 5-kinase [Podosphaera aphanis]|nr:Phosphatidylinositol 4-phosphate 5-kinase [Podosphaera aphanis]